ncbi:MAG: protein kinase [Polyangiaceae bacterium]
MAGTADLSSGAVFANDFRVVRQLSSGGMGWVYVVEQLSTSKQRALKLMRPEIMTSAEQRRRFELEAKVGARIQSDHVVEVIGAGVEEATNTPWLAMELLSGQELAAYAAENGPLSPATVGGLFEQICHAVGAAHEMQIVHRDLKPENIFLATSRRTGASFVVKILDFGIAKTLADARTKTTAAVGTPLWMAPEQTQPGAPIQPASDVWALGLIAFRLLAGKIFWRSAQFDDASPMMILREVVMDPIPSASARAAELGGAALPVGFDDWFARCTDRDPTKRFTNARELYEAMPAAMRASSLEHAPTLNVTSSMAPASSSRDGAAQPSGPSITAPTPQPRSRTEVAGTEMVAPLVASLPQTGSPAVIPASPMPARGGPSMTFLAAGGAAVVIAGIVGYLAFSGSQSGKGDARVESANAEVVTSVRPIATTADARPSSAPVTAPKAGAVPSASAVAEAPSAQPIAKVSAKPTATVEAPIPPKTVTPPPPKPPPTTPKPPTTTPKPPMPPPFSDTYPI